MTEYVKDLSFCARTSSPGSIPKKSGFQLAKKTKGVIVLSADNERKPAESGNETMKKDFSRNPEFEIKHEFSHDIIRQREENTRIYLFAKTFSPHLTANVISPSEFGFYKVSDSYQTPLHPHTNCSEFLIVLEGHYTCSIDGRTLTLGPTEGVLIQHGDIHRDDCRVPCVFLALNFELFDFLGRPWDGRIIKKPNSFAERCFSYAGNAELETLVALSERQTDSTCSFIKQFSYVFAQMLIWRFLDLLYDRISPQFKALLSNNLFQIRINRLFLDNLHCGLLVSEMAQAMKMSRKALELNCSRLLGSSPAKAFLSLKLERAAKLLKSGKSSKDVAAEFGFNNQFHFSRIFKSHFGLSASEYCARQ